MFTLNPLNLLWANSTSVDCVSLSVFSYPVFLVFSHSCVAVRVQLSVSCCPCLAVRVPLSVLSVVCFQLSCIAAYVRIAVVNIRGDAANSGLDALFYKTKFGWRNCFIFLYVLGILVDYTRTTLAHLNCDKSTTAQKVQKTCSAEFSASCNSVGIVFMSVPRL
jgi:hypothetical protein